MKLLKGFTMVVVNKWLDNTTHHNVFMFHTDIFPFYFAGVGSRIWTCVSFLQRASRCYLRTELNAAPECRLDSTIIVSIDVTTQSTQGESDNWGTVVKQYPVSYLRPFHQEGGRWGLWYLWHICSFSVICTKTKREPVYQIHYCISQLQLICKFCSQCFLLNLILTLVYITMFLLNICCISPFLSCSYSVFLVLDVWTHCNNNKEDSFFRVQVSM